MGDKLSNELLAAAACLWIVAAIIALFGRALTFCRVLLVAGCIAGIAAAVLTLPGSTAIIILPTQLAGQTVGFQVTADGLWLFGFGLAPAALACALASPSPQGHAGWLFGSAASLLGALGVFGVQDGAAFLIAWEVMSFGGAVMLLSENLSSDVGRPVLFMLGLLEAGALALVVVVLLLASATHSFAFETFRSTASAVPFGIAVLAGVLLVIGFGAKLGLLPFYEWFPGAYGAGSGASGAILSGVVINAAFFALSRGLLDWTPGPTAIGAAGLGIFVIIVGVVSAILSALYAFQEEDWRALLSFSSAENASIAVAMLGVALIFRADGRAELASLAWAVSLLHLAGHALAKGGLFLAADGVYRSTGRYAIFHTDLLRRGSWLFGAGALFAAMSLAAMPPQAGFVSEWYVFQTVFQGFRLDTLAGRLIMGLAGAGLALTVAIAFATFVKVFGIGLLGRSSRPARSLSPGSTVAVGLLGLGVLALAVGMPVWLNALRLAVASQFGTQAVRDMHAGLVLVPLTAKFAFISPTLLVIVMPLLAIIPILFVLASRRFSVRRAPVWYGGFDHDPERASTTALTFSNALRTFYSFIYRPREEVRREANGAVHYFVQRLVFSHEVAPVFGPYLFAPATRLIFSLASRLRALQSGHLNFYLALIGGIFVIVLALTLL
ncbi:MAG: proton-conducting transporter membrane subunit [Xanthobacteraceae bacterium]